MKWEFFKSLDGEMDVHQWCSIFDFEHLWIGIKSKYLEIQNFDRRHSLMTPNLKNIFFILKKFKKIKKCENEIRDFEN